MRKRPSKRRARLRKLRGAKAVTTLAPPAEPRRHVAHHAVKAKAFKDRPIGPLLGSARAWAVSDVFLFLARAMAIRKDFLPWMCERERRAIA
jgi:hypothetical protein